MTLLRKLWQAWKRLGEMLGTILAHIVLTVFYFSLFLPYAAVMTWLSDPLHIRRPMPGWTTRQADDASIEGARRQF